MCFTAIATPIIMTMFMPVGMRDGHGRGWHVGSLKPHNRFDRNMEIVASMGYDVCGVEAVCCLGVRMWLCYIRFGLWLNIVGGYEHD